MEKKRGSVKSASETKILLPKPRKQEILDGNAMGGAIRFPDKDLPEKAKWVCLLPSLERRGAFQLLRQLLQQSEDIVSGSL